RLKDVARVELGALTYGFSATFNGSPAVPIGVYLQPGANAIQVAAAVKATMDNLAKRFPEGLRYDIPFNTTRFVEVSIEEVIITIILSRGHYDVPTLFHAREIVRRQREALHARRARRRDRRAAKQDVRQCGPGGSGET
ncbi:MAG: efflux RND transporter permease subunit, partial [Gammaproteobacteria bacterium]|nr:efflux RND transporter permease subunit [Gammaproteobacteria bacterium]